jgi:hypothetical protein
MLFILADALRVGHRAQTRILEGVTFFLLRKYGGRILPTVIAVTASSRSRPAYLAASR